MIGTQNLAFSFGAKTEPLFEDLSIDVQEGEILAILGRNGVGKTTFLKCILGLQNGYTGTLQSVEYVGYVPQKIFPTFDMPALEMIVMGRMPYLGLFGQPDKNDYDIAKRIAADLDIESLLDVSFNDLSGGQKQMVLIARALCTEPAAILFDEPMSALDYSNQNRVLGLINKIAKQGMTVIFTTHDPTHAIHVADKVLLMKDHATHYFGQTQDVLTDDNLHSVYDLALCVQQVQNNSVVVPIFKTG